MMNDDIVSFIGQCANLEKLTIRDNSLYDASCTSYKANPELIKELVYRGWDVEL